MSFLQRVIGQAGSTVPGVPVARPKGLVFGGLPSAPEAPVEPALPSAAAPIRQEPRPGPAPLLETAPERTASPQPDAAPAAPPARPTAEISAPIDLRADTPFVVEQQASAAIEESGPPTEPARTTPSDQRQPGPSVFADAEPASEPPDPQSPRRPIREIAEPQNAPQASLPPQPGPEHPAEQGLARQVPDDAPTTPGEPPDRRARAHRVEPPQPEDGAPLLETRAPAPADRPIEEGDRRPVEVVPIARPLTPSPAPLPLVERALPSRPATPEKRPLLQIDQIDVVVTDPTPAPAAAARPFAAVAANRRYLRRL